jgi:hypothetical protein
MPFTTGAVSLGAIQDLWKRSTFNSTVSFSDFYRTTNADNYHSEGLPIATGTSDLSLSDFRGVPVPIAGSVDKIKASGNSSTTDIVASNQRFNPGIDLSTESAWLASGRTGGAPNAVTKPVTNIFDQNSHYFFANSGTYMYFQDEDNPGLNGSGDFARVTLSTAYDITTPAASSYVDYNMNRVDLRTIVDANKPSSNHSSSTYFTNPPSGQVPPCIYMKNDGTKIWGVALDMRWMAESFSNQDGDTLVEFTLTTPYNLSTATWSTYHVFTDDNVKNSRLMGFSADGTVLLVQGQNYSPADKRLAKYSLSTAWNISTISYSGASVLWIENSGFEDIAGIDFYQGLSSNKPTKAFFVDGNDEYYSYNLSVTGLYNPVFTLTGSTTKVGGLPFANGSKRIIAESNIDYPSGGNSYLPKVIKKVSLSTAYDLDTVSSYNPATYATSIPAGVTLVDGDIIVEHQSYNMANPNVCICWSSDGTKVFYLGRTTSDDHPKIYTENCTTPWTLEGVDFTVSSTTNSNYPLPFTSSRQKALGIELNNDGTKLFVTYAIYGTSGNFFNRRYTGYCYILEFAMNSQPVYAPYTIANDGTDLSETHNHYVTSFGPSSNASTAFNAYNLQTRFSPDGKSLLLLNNGNNNNLIQKTLTTAYDITTANNYSTPASSPATGNINFSNLDLGLRLQKTGTGSFWSSGDWNVSDVGIDGYSVIAQNYHAGSDYPVAIADNKVVFRTINQDDSTLPNVVASLFSDDREDDGFLLTQGSAAQDWGSGMTSAGPAHSFEVKKEFVLNSDGRWPIMFIRIFLTDLFYSFVHFLMMMYLISLGYSR